MKIANLNMEGDTHLGLVEAFVQHEKPHVLCLEEVFEGTLPIFTAMGYNCEFLPMTDKLHAGTPDAWGIALCTTGTLTDRQDMYYRDVVYPPSDAILNILKTRGVVKNGFKNGLLCARVTVDDADCYIAVTHFTWGPEGETATPEQHASMDALLAYTKNLEPHVLCGDFNLPRNYNPLYERLAQVYTDNVPETYASSLDKTLHRLGGDASKQHLFSSFMVDYMFSRPPYQVSDVRLVFGVSDHAAVVGHVTKNTSEDVS